MQPTAELKFCANAASLSLLFFHPESVLCRYDMSCWSVITSRWERQE